MYNAYYRIYTCVEGTCTVYRRFMIFIIKHCCGYFKLYYILHFTEDLLRVTFEGVQC
jgi:hypothetical protein